ncbi:MAG: ribbon-helix-helix protein, CopG family [Pseudomonadales bacterium]
MPLKATSVRLDDETLERVGQIAEAMDRPRAWLMSYAIKQYVEREAWFVCEVEKGKQAADEGRLQDHAAVNARWEAKRAAQVD